jgi:hypothetical protein
MSPHRQVSRYRRALTTLRSELEQTARGRFDAPKVRAAVARILFELTGAIGALRKRDEDDQGLM